MRKYLTKFYIPSITIDLTSTLKTDTALFR